MPNSSQAMSELVVYSPPMAMGQRQNWSCTHAMFLSLGDPQKQQSYIRLSGNLNETSKGQFGCHELFQQLTSIKCECNHVCSQSLTFKIAFRFCFPYYCSLISFLSTYIPKLSIRYRRQTFHPIKCATSSFCAQNSQCQKEAGLRQAVKRNNWTTVVPTVPSELY